MKSKLLIGFAVAYFTTTTIVLSLVLTLSYSASRNVDYLITSGKTPAAQRLAVAASVDKELICAVLRPALLDHKTPTSIKAVILKDCPKGTK